MKNNNTTTTQDTTNLPEGVNLSVVIERQELRRGGLGNPFYRITLRDEEGNFLSPAKEIKGWKALADHYEVPQGKGISGLAADVVNSEDFSGLIPEELEEKAKSCGVEVSIPTWESVLPKIASVYSLQVKRGLLKNRKALTDLLEIAEEKTIPLEQAEARRRSSPAKTQSSEPDPFSNEEDMPF